MSQYLLSVHAVEGIDQESMTQEEMQESMKDVMELEAEMKGSGVFVFGGKLHDAAEAVVVRSQPGGVSMTDGPFAEAKEQIAGFYIINATDLAEAHRWAERVVSVIKVPLEVRPFFDMPGA
jgi:hypothetical protein